MTFFVREKPLEAGRLTRVIVRLVIKNRMVTKGYHEGVYERVTIKPAQKR